MTTGIVVAVASGSAARVVDTAFELAEVRGLPLLAVRIWHEPGLPLGGWLDPERTTRWDAAHAAARRELERALDEARAAHPTVAVRIVVADDDLVPFLVALSTQAEVLVVGRCTRLGHGASPVDTLVRQATCPVLVVPPLRRSPVALASAGS